MSQALIDSSYLVALHDTSDQYHTQAMSFARGANRLMLIPMVVLPETAYILRRQGGIPAVSLFLKTLVAEASALEPIKLADLARAQMLINSYPAAKLDLVDCLITAMAERLNITDVCTFDRRDFLLIRPSHAPHFTLIS